MKEPKEKHRSFGSVIRIIVLIVALGVFCYAGWQLYLIYHGYAAAGSEYDNLKNEFTTPNSGADTSSDEASDSSPDGSAAASSEGGDSSSADETVSWPAIEDAEPPVDVDWNDLKSINPDIVGWLYIDAEDNISYPICKGTDNSYYLHHTFRKEALFAGSIFMDYNNSGEFTDPNTVIYGHNMKNGSMFGMLKFIKGQKKYDSDPYFWILTPKGNYRYHIYAAFDTAVDSDTYTLFSANGPEFLAWEQKMQGKSEVANSVPLTADDKTVTLSTCTSDSSTRCVILGKCVSTAKPVKS
ncbi:MAG TPA: class B sortase [Lachnospiraceae bacterium]|nr:class B sortase [Lachnospiraceae bacterium]